MPRRSSAPNALVSPALVALVALAALAAAVGPYREGEEVAISGVVTDRLGEPLPDLQVELVASRSTFSFLKLGKVQREPRRVATVTGADGEFRLAWPWHEFFNHFELEVGLVVQEPAGERLEPLERLDVSRRILQGGQVVVAVTVADSAPVAEYRAFLDSIASDDQRRIFEQKGRPGRVDRADLAGRIEVTWWYFGSGQAFRFEDGRLEQVVDFDPVESF